MERAGAGCQGTLRMGSWHAIAAVWVVGRTSCCPGLADNLLGNTARAWNLHNSRQPHSRRDNATATKEQAQSARFWAGSCASSCSWVSWNRPHLLIALGLCFCAMYAGNRHSLRWGVHYRLFGILRSLKGCCYKVTAVVGLAIHDGGLPVTGC